MASNLRKVTNDAKQIPFSLAEEVSSTAVAYKENKIITKRNTTLHILLQTSSNSRHPTTPYSLSPTAAFPGCGLSFSPFATSPPSST